MAEDTTKQAKHTGYELSRSWWDFAFENPEKVRPIHAALYFFAIEHCNRLGWKKKFGLPTEMTKDAIGVKSWHTYIRAFNDLVEWGFFILIEKSKNQYSSNIIALSKFDEALDEALDNAIAKHMTKHISKHQRSTYQSTYQSNDSINKPITINNITKEQYKSIFDNFRKIYPGVKLGLNTEFDNLQKKHKDCFNIIPELEEIIKNQINHREKLKIAGEFVPPWKNLKTWINNRCWEEVVESTAQENKAKWKPKLRTKWD